LRQVPAFAEDFEVLLLNDGSTDHTGELMDAWQARDSRVRVIHHPYNLGFRGLTHTLPKNACKEWYAGISADGEIELEDVGRMFQVANHGFDIVVGVRRAKPNYGPYRRVVSSGYNECVRRIFGHDFRDPGALKLFRTRILKEINVVSTSAFINAERLIRAARLGYRIGFVEIVQKPRFGGKPKGASTAWVIRSVVDLGRVAWHLEACERMSQWRRRSP